VAIIFFNLVYSRGGEIAVVVEVALGRGDPDKLRLKQLAVADGAHTE